jgi:hypothetical protein
MDNFTTIRNGIREHIKGGKLNPFDLGIYLFLHLWADWSTGIYYGCALSIAFMFGGDFGLKGHIQQSLRRLRKRHYINYRKGDGARGAYPILIHKYEPTVGKLLGTRLNAWKQGDLVQPEYEPINCGATVVPQPSNGVAIVTTPTQDLKTLAKTEDEDPLIPNHANAIPDFLRIWNENCGGLPKLREMTKGRIDKLRARCQRKPTFEHDFTEAVKKAAQTPFLLGENDRGWKANFDWLISNDTNHVAVLEGKYDGVRKESPDKRGAFVNDGDVTRYERGADFTMRVG